MFCLFSMFGDLSAWWLRLRRGWGAPRELVRREWGAMAVVKSSGDEDFRADASGVELRVSRGLVRRINTRRGRAQAAVVGRIFLRGRDPQSSAGSTGTAGAGRHDVNPCAYVDRFVILKHFKQKPTQPDWPGLIFAREVTLPPMASQRQRRRVNTEIPYNNRLQLHFALNSNLKHLLYRINLRVYLHQMK